MTPSTMAQALDRIGDLEAEVAFLRDELGLMQSSSEVGALQMAFQLTKMEGRLLLALYRRDRTIRQDALLSILYADRPNEPELKIIDVFVCKIRRKVPAAWIETAWGNGYFLTPECRAALALLLANLSPSERAA